MNKIGIKVANRKGYIECELGGVADFLYPSSTTRRGRVQGNGQICPAIQTESEICRVESEFAIRKITAKESGRLMNVAEKDIIAIENTVSSTQQYKQFGNSIVVAVLIAIFSQLNIDGCKTWNEMSDDERYELIYKGCYKKGAEHED